MKKIKGIENNGSCLYEGDGQLDQKIQRVTNENENFLDILGEDTGDKLISLNKACEWLDHNRPIGTGDPEWEDTIEDFKKAMEL